MEEDSADRIVVRAYLVPVGKEMPAGRTKADANRDGGDGEDDAVAKARMAADGTDTFMAAVWHFGTLLVRLDSFAVIAIVSSLSEWNP